MVKGCAGKRKIKSRKSSAEEKRKEKEKKFKMNSPA